MKQRRAIIIVIFTILSSILIACDDEANESSSYDSNDSTQNHAYSENLTPESVEDSKNDFSENLDDLEETNEDTYESSIDENVLSNNEEDNDMVLSKSEYLEKLNQMEEEDRFAESKSTIVELEEQEKERYQKWDQELNKIYGILIEQLSTVEMDQLREEQRDWIVYRDQTAKESSLQYKGGSTEALEYVATQANLTRERCYTLVAQYMQ